MLPDNRIRFSAARIDLETEVGLTGQDHDNYPAPGEQARYDWMKIFLIGLLSCQASYTAPTQYRDGTLWYDLTNTCYKMWSGSAWVNLADAIAIGDTNLSDWYNSVSDTITDMAPTMTFSGICTTDGSTIITIPASIVPKIQATHKAFIFKNGILEDPRNNELLTPTINLVNGAALNSGDTFTIEIRNVSTSHLPNVIVS